MILTSFNLRMLIHGIGALSTVYIFNKYRQRDLIQAKTILTDDIVEIKGRDHYVTVVT